MMSVEEYKEQSASMETGTESSQGNGQDGTTEEETEAMVHDNKCIYSVDEAKTIADDFLLDLGISDVQVKGVSDLMWTAATLSVQVNGMVIFSCMDGQRVHRWLLIMHIMILIICQGKMVI